MLITVLFTFGGCMFDDSGSVTDGPAYIGSLKVYGIVTTENGQPLEGVHITTENGLGQVIGVYSDAMGVFSFASVRTKDSRFVIEADKEGYFHKSYASTSAGKDAKVRLALNTKNTTNITADAPSEVAVADKARVLFKPNSFVQENGTPYSGEVTVAYTYANPDNPAFGLLMQGGDLRGLDASRQTQRLISYGAMGVELTGSNGQTLQLAPGQTATLEMEVPESMLANAPAQIPLWYFDEQNNIWVEEGSATLQGNKYVGEVSHFTWWNCDDPVSIKSFVIGTVVDCNGSPMPGVVVSVGPLLVTTNADGSYISNVASGLEFNVLVDPIFNFGLESSNTIYVASAPEEGVMTLEPLVMNCPAFLSGNLNLCSDYSAYLVMNSNTYWPDYIAIPNNFSRIIPGGTELQIVIQIQSAMVVQRYNFTIPALAEGSTYTLPAIELGCPVTIQGTVVDCSQQPTASQINAVWEGGSYYYSTTYGDYSFSVPSNLPVSITATRHLSSLITESETITVLPVPEGENLHIAPNIELSCPATVSGTVSSCSGTPLTVIMHVITNDFIYNLQVVGGAFSIQVPGNEPVTLKASAFADGDYYNGEITLTPPANQITNASFQLCNLLAYVDCPIAGVQLITDNAVISFGSLTNYVLSQQITVPLATASPTLNLPQTFNLPTGYTNLKLQDGPIYCTLILPGAFETGTYNIASYSNVALNSPIGMMLVNNNTISAIITEGTVTINNVGPDNISGSFSGVPGNIISNSQFPSVTFLPDANFSGTFCFPY
ncbi:hypothetical protein C7N43_07350 [Sphingobacteriales bacterium UPWRP_1]|nr:hypothetical protein B6N25_05190 [Sphingobacteriales bacterium TSM_CSS]PSJ77689.1 hypothetical protein C7N43_07350 [Sphingobacteriales bacterium UPWRP_1]